MSPSHQSASAKPQHMAVPDATQHYGPPSLYSIRSFESTLPSYARPTVSSQAKRITPQSRDTVKKTSNPTDKDICTVPTRKELSPTTRLGRPPPGRRYHTAYLTTQASRAKAPKKQPFRFMDLPGELRNQIYRYLMPTFWDTHSASLHLCCGDVGDWQARPVLNLLQVRNKQFLEEVGSYYLTRQLDIYMGAQEARFAYLLRVLGKRNVLRLVMFAKGTPRSYEESRRNWVLNHVEWKRLW